MSTDGEVANALVCKTSIRGFDPHSVLHTFDNLRNLAQEQAAYQILRRMLTLLRQGLNPHSSPR